MRRRQIMLLKEKNAVIYGAGGAVGGAVARAFVREGAKVFLTGRNLDTIRVVAATLAADGGIAEVAQVDALDEHAVEQHASAMTDKVGSIDISFNAIGIPQQGIQGIPLTQLSVESFALPISTYTRAHFLTARAAARRMAETGAGVILMHTPEPARLGAPLVGGMGPAWAALEALSRSLSAEYASHGVRAVCLRSTGIPETHTIDVVFGLHGKAMGIPREEFQALMESMSHTRRSTTLAELANVAVFIASDLASGMTGTVANLTGGKIVD
jgi:NAD(P)-dependent dehydrogenase (short-subunit alcohol dehydrogenase family)